MADAVEKAAPQWLRMARWFSRWFTLTGYYERKATRRDGNH